MSSVFCFEYIHQDSCIVPTFCKPNSFPVTWPTIRKQNFNGILLPVQFYLGIVN